MFWRCCLMKNDDKVQGRWVAVLSGMLLLAYIAAAFTAVRFYQIDSVYRAAVFLNQALTATSLCVGPILVGREIHIGRSRNALCFAILVAVVGGILAIVMLGEILLPDPH